MGDIEGGLIEAKIRDGKSTGFGCKNKYSQRWMQPAWSPKDLDSQHKKPS